MAREELKIAIIIKTGQIFLGALENGCDPKVTTLRGNLQTALARLPSFIEEADRQWDASPRNPRSTVPEPPAPARTVTQVANRQTTVKTNQSTQPNFF
jgi:hypothetical protein